MLQSVIDWIGSYTPVMTDVYDASGVVVGQVVASGVAGVDWPWIMTSLFGLVVIYCLFKLIGGALK